MSRSHCVLVIASFVLVAACTKEEPAPTPSSKPATTAASTASASVVPASSPTPAAPVAEPPPAEITAQHILVGYKGAKGAPKTVTRSKADAKKRAEEVLEKIKAGSDFSALVKEYSEDPGSKERMGSLGKFKRDQMVKAFGDAAFALKVDEVSGIVETQFGFHVIKRNQ